MALGFRPSNQKGNVTTGFSKSARPALRDAELPPGADIGVHPVRQFLHKVQLGAVRCRFQVLHRGHWKADTGKSPKSVMQALCSNGREGA